MITTNKPENPRLREDFVELMKKHGGMTITYADAREYGACINGLRFFKMLHFPGREEVQLRELIPLIEASHLFWSDMKRVLPELLIARGVLDPEWRSTNLMFRPGGELSVPLGSRV